MKIKMIDRAKLNKFLQKKFDETAEKMKCQEEEKKTQGT